MRRYLVVANQTLGGAHLREKVEACKAEGPCSFHVVVPATRPKDHATWTEGEARAIAQERLEGALTWFAEVGATAGGEVGDERPMLAIGDAILEQDFDEIIISTLPGGASRWLRQDLPTRAERTFGLPVTHLVGEPAPEKRSA